MSRFAHSESCSLLIVTTSSCVVAALAAWKSPPSQHQLSLNNKHQMEPYWHSTSTKVELQQLATLCFDVARYALAWYVPAAKAGPL